MGWVDAAGNGAFVLAIRGVFVGERDLLATAGAGIVAGSLPQAEVAETEMKLRSVLEAAAPGAALHLF
jgi:isochorismate synthase EntC